MLKVQKEYQEKYGDIPLDFDQRLYVLIRKLRKTRRKKKIDIFDEIKRIKDIKWKEYKFTIYLLPKATPRPRINRFKGLFYVSGSDINKKLFKKFLEKHPHEMIYTPMYFYTNIYLPTPSNMKPEEAILAEYGYIRPVSKPDFDNVAKTYADMITGSLIYDDSLIIEGTSKKFYSIKPRIEIIIRYMEEFDSLFNQKKIESKINKKG